MSNLYHSKFYSQTNQTFNMKMKFGQHCFQKPLGVGKLKGGGGGRCTGGGWITQRCRSDGGEASSTPPTRTHCPGPPSYNGNKPRATRKKSPPPLRLSLAFPSLLFLEGAALHACTRRAARRDRAEEPYYPLAARPPSHVPGRSQGLALPPDPDRARRLECRWCRRRRSVGGC